MFAPPPRFSALATVTILALGPCALAQRPALELTDLSESGAALAFTQTERGVTIRPLAAAQWDALELEVRGATAGQGIVFTVPGLPVDLTPAVTTGQFRWQPAHVLPPGPNGAHVFAWFPTGSRFVVRLAPPRATSRDAPYYTYSRFVQYLASLRGYENLQITRIGTTVQGRPLYRMLIDTPSNFEKKTVLMAVRQHGNEDASSYILEGFLELMLGEVGERHRDLLRRVRWIIYPLMNPDGAFARQRGNARGVDLNRNWDRAGCSKNQEPEIFATQCDLEQLTRRFPLAIGGDHHGWGSANHGGYRYAQGQGVSFVTAPEHQEARKDTTVITRHDPSQFAWQENGGTTGMLRAEMFHRFGCLFHTPEYNSSISTAEEFRAKGRAWAHAMRDTLFAPRFTDAAGNDRRAAAVPDQLWVTVDDDDENRSATVREQVRVTVRDRATGDVEQLVLVETGPDTGVFRNPQPLPLVGAAATAGDEQLSSTARSTAVARYRDDDYPRDTSTAQIAIRARADT